MQLGQQRNEFQTVIVNMREGLVLLNQSGRILLINRSGRNLMKAMAEEDDLAAGEEIITSRNSVVDSLLDKAYDGKTSSATIIINSRSYEIHASPVESDEGIHGAVLFYVDVTEKVEAEQLRREFSANVSHELKRRCTAFPAAPSLCSPASLKKKTNRASSSRSTTKPSIWSR